MNKGCVEIFCGNGRGKTSMALGKSIRSCSRGNSVVIIQFLKGKETVELNYLNNMNLEIKLFRFEKSNKYYEDLNEQSGRFRDCTGGRWKPAYCQGQGRGNAYDTHRQIYV